MKGKRNHESTRELLVSLPDAEVPAVLHLLTCEECYTQALRWLAERSDLPERPGEDASGAGDLARLEWGTPGLLEAFERQRAEDQSLLGELLSLPAGERARAVERDTRFQRERLAELALVESGRQAPRNPGRGEEMARLAFTLAVHLAPRLPQERADSLRARACCRLGDALRRARRREESAAAFRQSAFYLRGPMDSVDRALFSSLLARLRAGQGRLDEASALLHYAAALYRLNAEDQERGLCLAALGFLHLEEGDAAGALGPLSTARKLLDVEEDPATACRARLALALCLVSLSRKGAAGLVQEARELYPGVRSFGELVRFYWMEARVAARLGNGDEAADLLQRVRGRLLAEGDLYEAALATLDLALLLAQEERLPEVHPLIHELREAFSAHPGMEGALLALAAFEAVAAGGGDDLEKLAAVAAAFLRRMRRGREKGLE